jgi:L-fuculose-phosphate aldolase
MNDEPRKELLDGYVGVKFKPVPSSRKLLPEAEGLYEVFRSTGGRLMNYGMAPANGGNLSIRHGKGFFVTAAGCNLGCIETDELIFVEHCDLDSEEVLYRGPVEPSSESIMHWLIYRNRPQARAIIHAHDLATRPELLKGRVEESSCEEPYGTVELARMAIETFERAERIIVLKNHGYVAVGESLENTCDLVVETHLRLL